MTLLAIQIVAVLLLAFLLGCVAGCWLSGWMDKPRRSASPAGNRSGRVGRALAPEPRLQTAAANAAREPVNGRDGSGATEADDLKLLTGIGPVLEKKLHTLGITRFSQIAAWEDGDIERMDTELRFKGRIRREGWVAQARVLAGNGAAGAVPRPAAKQRQPRRPAGK